jgi:hypothetical protein
MLAWNFTEGRISLEFHARLTILLTLLCPSYQINGGAVAWNQIRHSDLVILQAFGIRH